MHRKILTGLSVLILCAGMGGVARADVPAKNVSGGALQSCSTAPMTGYGRDGYYNADPQDSGQHVVCARVTEQFLTYTRTRGNDLSTPRPENAFPGLKPGDKWCLCAARWKEAEAAGAAPEIDPAATHEKALETIDAADVAAHSAKNE